MGPNRQSSDRPSQAPWRAEKENAFDGSGPIQSSAGPSVEPPGSPSAPSPSLPPSALPFTALDLERSIVKESFVAFAKRAWKHIDSTPLIWGRHLDVICQALEDVYNWEIRDLIINIPPGCGKSILISVLWPCWLWAQDPSYRFFAASYAAVLGSPVLRDNDKMMRLIKSPWYQSLFPEVQLTSEVTTKFETSAGGYRLGVGVGGAGFSEHPDFGLIDDPMKPQDAFSDVAIKNVETWMKGVISTRIGRKLRTVLLMARLAEDDLSNYCESIGWKVIRLPMEYDPEIASPEDWRTEKGQLLWPEKYPEEEVRKMKIAMGPYAVSAQLQQRPSKVGEFFKREYFKFVEKDEIPWYRLVIGRGWDTAGTLKAGDTCAGIKIGIDIENFRVYVLNAIWEQTDRVDIIITETAKLDGKECITVEEREPGGSGKAVVEGRQRSLKGYAYIEVPVSKNKITRARPLRTEAESSGIYLLKDSEEDISDDSGWNQRFLGDMLLFPKRDDTTDGFSVVYNALMELPEMKSRGVVW